MPGTILLIALILMGRLPLRDGLRTTLMRSRRRRKKKAARITWAAISDIRSALRPRLAKPERPLRRGDVIAELIADMPGVSVESFDGLTVKYAAQKKADVILRGLRSLTDVQYEFQLAMTNRSVAGVETVFIMTSEQYGFTSSTLIREVASLGGDVSRLVPKIVYARIQQKLKK